MRSGYVSRLSTGSGGGVRASATSPAIRHVGAVDDAVVARGKVVALAGRAVAFIGRGVIDGHVVVLEHLADLRRPLEEDNHCISV